MGRALSLEIATRGCHLRPPSTADTTKKAAWKQGWHSPRERGQRTLVKGATSLSLVRGASAQGWLPAPLFPGAPKCQQKTPPTCPSPSPQEQQRRNTRASVMMATCQASPGSAQTRAGSWGWWRGPQSHPEALPTASVCPGPGVGHRQGHVSTLAGISQRSSWKPSGRGGAGRDWWQSAMLYLASM